MFLTCTFESRLQIVVGHRLLLPGPPRGVCERAHRQNAIREQRAGQAWREQSCLVQHPGDGGDGVPVARGGRRPEDPVERAEIADDLHVAPVDAEDEPVVPREDFSSHVPVEGRTRGSDGVTRGRWDNTLTKRTMSGRTGWAAKCVQDISLAMSRPSQIAICASNGTLACQFSAELGPGDRPPNHEGARRADVDGIEVLQSFGERTWPEGPVTADVHASQKNHECHEPLLSSAGSSNNEHQPGRPREPHRDELAPPFEVVDKCRDLGCMVLWPVLLRQQIVDHVDSAGPQ